MQSIDSILAVPNLQGHKEELQLKDVSMIWVSPQDGLEEQVEAIRLEYTNQSILLGASFGGIAAWQFSLENSPEALRALILMDVLPSLQAFPQSKRMAHRVLQRVPLSIAERGYRALRRSQGDIKPVVFASIQSKIESLFASFPRSYPTLPCLILSENPQFHAEWRSISKNRPWLQVQMRGNTERQITQWLSSVAN